MTPAQFGNVSIFKTGPNEFVGFHNVNLEVARLSPSLVDSFEAGKQSEELTELKSWSESVSESCKTSTLAQKIRTITVNATQLCNLKCTYCAAGGDGTYGDPQVKFDLKKGLPQLEWLIRQCEEGTSFQINFLGGEPLLYPETISQVAQWAQDFGATNKINVRFAVVTNGTRLLDVSVLALLIKFKIAVTVSVDGPPHVQDKFRPTKAGTPSSSILEAGLKQLSLIKEQLPSVGLSAVFHKDHLEIVQTYDYFRRWNFDFYELNFSHTDFDSEASKSFAKELSEVAALADAIGGECELRKIRHFDSIFQRLDDQVRVENFCGAGKSMLSMDARGSLFSCPWEISDRQLSLGQERESVLVNLPKYAQSQLQSRNCGSCWARFLCGGGCQYIHSRGTHSKDRVDQDFCDRTKNTISTLFIYYEKYRSFNGEAY
ncbi:MAG: hypothetical protein RJB66_645 [Pseudomonadota bacterium]|jgi:uncharacterized protein